MKETMSPMSPGEKMFLEEKILLEKMTVGQAKASKILLFLGCAILYIEIVSLVPKSCLYQNSIIDL